MVCVARGGEAGAGRLASKCACGRPAFAALAQIRAASVAGVRAAAFEPRSELRYARRSMRLLQIRRADTAGCEQSPPAAPSACYRASAALPARCPAPATSEITPRNAMLRAPDDDPGRRISAPAGSPSARRRTAAWWPARPEYAGRGPKASRHSARSGNRTPSAITAVVTAVRPNSTAKANAPTASAHHTPLRRGRDARTNGSNPSSCAIDNAIAVPMVSLRMVVRHRRSAPCRRPGAAGQLVHRIGQGHAGATDQRGDDHVLRLSGATSGDRIATARRQPASDLRLRQAWPFCATMSSRPSATRSPGGGDIQPRQRSSPATADEASRRRATAWRGTPACGRSSTRIASSRADLEPARHHVLGDAIDLANCRDRCRPARCGLRG